MKKILKKNTEGLGIYDQCRRMEGSKIKDHKFVEAKEFLCLFFEHSSLR